MNPVRFKFSAFVFAAAVMTQAGGASAQSSSITINGCASLTLVSGTTFTCNTVPSNPSGPTGCAVTQAPSLPVGGGSVNLSASCTGGATVSSVTWTKNGNAFSGAFPDVLPQNTATTAALYTYTATFNWSGTPAPTASTTATVAAASAPPPPPPPTSGGACGNYAAVEMGAVPLTGNPVTSNNFSANTVAIASFTVPAGYPARTNTIAVYEYGSAPTYRRAWMSKTRCDMGATSSPYYLSSDGPVFQYNIGGSDPNAVPMVPGETWYLMVVNERPWGLGASCGSGTCNIGVKWYPPVQ